MVTSNSGSDCDGFTLSNSGGSYIHINVISILVLDTIVAVFTVFINSVFLLTYVKTPALHSPANIIVCALFICDLFVGIVSHTFYLTILFLFESNNTAGSNLETTFEVVFLLSSGFSCIVVAILSLDRYFAVCYPYAYRRVVTSEKCIKVIAGGSAIWLVCTVTALRWRKFFKSSHALFSTLILLVLGIVMFCYFNIYRVIQKQKRTQPILRNTRNVQSLGGSTVRREKQHSYIMAFIISVFLLLHLPYLGFTLYYLGWSVPLCNDSTLVIYLWDEFFMLLTSCSNPILYGLKRRDFRTAALRLIKLR